MNVIDYEKKKILNYIIEKNDIEKLKILIKNGIDLNINDKSLIDLIKDEKIKLLLIELIQNKEKYFSLINRNESKLLRKFLSKNKNIINFKNNKGQSGLHLSLELKLFHISKYLIDHQININLIDNFGKSALHYCCEINNFEISEILLRKGINVNIQSFYFHQLTKKNFPDKIALHYCYINKNIKLIELLLKYKSDENIKDFNNKKPIDYFENSE